MSDSLLFDPTIEDAKPGYHTCDLFGDLSFFQPTYLNGGTWLKPVDASHSLTARFARCVLNHAPIGAYYQRFNMDEPTTCVCGTALETRTHILNQCPLYRRKGPVRRVYDLANTAGKQLSCSE